MQTAKHTALKTRKNAFESFWPLSLNTRAVISTAIEVTIPIMPEMIITISTLPLPKDKIGSIVDLIPSVISVSKERTEDAIRRKFFIENMLIG